MKLYYHHVGKKGAEEDFKKTVFARVPISLVESSIPDNEPFKALLLSELNEKFPIGSFNCWGVPGGAASVIQNLSVGDAVLLVETATVFGGNIPALCFVKTFIRHELPQLSYALWGNSHFPYIFFFETEPLEFEWNEFISDLGYAPNFDPRGKFYSVADDKLAKLGGVRGYIEKIRQKQSGKPVPIYVAKEYLTASVKEESPHYQASAIKELTLILEESESTTPVLTDENPKAPVLTQIPPRDAAFSAQIKLIYGERCAVCGSNRHTRDGNPEVEGAHIYPKSLKGRDVTQNGISLCKLHHWAFDCGWFSIADDLTIIVHSQIIKTIHYTFITEYEGKKIAVPENRKDHPHPVFLSAHRKLHGFD
jgi:hypothetical protein